MSKAIIDLPQVGESVTQGVIGKWLKSAGDTVEKYEPLVEVVTDKVNMEVPSPLSGTVIKLLVSEGDVVLMGSPILELDVPGDPPPSRSIESGSSLKGSFSDESIDRNAVARKFEFMDTVRSVGPTGSGEGGHGRPDVRQSIVDQSPYEISKGTDGISHLSPVVRDLAREHAIDIADVTGTGLNGRITKQDINRYIESLAIGGKSSRTIRDDQDILELSPIRKTIAERMERGSQIPTAWTMVEVDVEGLIACRDALKKEFRIKSGVSLTFLPFVIEATAKALREYPLLNGMWDGDRILLNKNVHIGFAVASPNGLIVPVIHHADSLSITDLAVQMFELVKNARVGKLRLENVQRGTFTVDNTGALGLVVSVPIINGDQAAILATEAIVRRPVVVGEEVRIRSIMNLSMTFDHRVCDGLDAAKFLARIKGILESINETTEI